MNPLYRYAISALAAGLALSQPAAAVELIKGRQLADNKEVRLQQIIIKYRNESAVQSYSSNTGNPAGAFSQAQTQRLNSVQAAARSIGASFSIRRQMVTGAWVFRAASPISLAQMHKMLKQLSAADSSIEYAEPDYIRRPAYTPTDPLYQSGQWDLQASAAQAGAINLPAAWDLSMGKNIVVAVLDTGYRPHPDLLPNLIAAPGGTANQYGYNFISDPATARISVASGVTSARGQDAIDMGDWVDAGDPACAASASSWHGTHVSGTIAAAANNIGVIGVAPQARILPLRVLGKCGGTDSDIGDALAWAAGIHVNGVPDNSNKANVVNLSLGGPGVCTKTMSAVFQSLMSNGVVVVVAAGNDSRDARMSSPANCPGVIAVASTNISGGRSSYSNYGPISAVAAPGGGGTNNNDFILSTLPTGDTVASDDTTYGYMAGTSQATPHVAGVAALMLAVKPTLAPAQVRSLLIRTARSAPANCPGCSAGIIDAAAAVKAAAGS